MAAITTQLSYGPGVFTDEEFEKAARELGEPDLVGWEFFVESHNTKIYRKYKEVGRTSPQSWLLQCGVYCGARRMY